MKKIVIIGGIVTVVFLICFLGMMIFFHHKNVEKEKQAKKQERMLEEEKKKQEEKEKQQKEKRKEQIIEESFQEELIPSERPNKFFGKEYISKDARQKLVELVFEEDSDSVNLLKEQEYECKAFLAEAFSGPGDYGDGHTEWFFVKGMISNVQEETSFLHFDFIVEGTTYPMVYWKDTHYFTFQDWKEIGESNYLE